MTNRVLNLRAATLAVVLLVVTGAVTFALTAGGSSTSPGEEELSPLRPSAAEIVVGAVYFLVVAALVFLVIRWVVARAYRRGSSRTSD